MGSKGGRFERAIAKTLSKWLTGGHDDTQLIRSIQSGGWSLRQDRQAGDLAANGPRGRYFRETFVVECKARESFKWPHIWSSGDPPLAQWWEQVNTDADDFRLTPLLIYSKNYYPNLVGLPPEIIEDLYDEARRVTITWGELDYRPVSLIELDHFLTLDPDVVIDRGRRYIKQYYPSGG